MPQTSIFYHTSFAAQYSKQFKIYKQKKILNFWFLPKDFSYFMNPKVIIFNIIPAHGVTKKKRHGIFAFKLYFCTHKLTHWPQRTLLNDSTLTLTNIMRMLAQTCVCVVAGSLCILAKICVWINYPINSYKWNPLFGNCLWTVICTWFGALKDICARIFISWQWISTPK